MRRFCALALLLVLSVEGFAQSYPSRPVRIVVPLSPGGFADTPTRMLAPRLSEQLGKPFFIDNKPGAGGTIGAEFVAKSAPDGHTLVITGSTHVITSHLYKKLPYDAINDFTHICMMASGPYALVVNAQKVPAASVRELIALVKAQPGKIDYASSGNGSSQHLVGALFNVMAGVELNHVPYKGSGPAMQDLLAAQVGVSFAGIPNVLGHVKAGRLRALGVTTPKRWVELPEVPTLAEAGVPGYEATLWLSISGPPGMPPPIVQRLHAEISKALQDPELQSSFRAAGVEALSMGPEELGRFMRAEHAKWGKVVRETGATVN
jgi:tripartite-type tricarboxylate transporter receptor subunit TctC